MLEKPEAEASAEEEPVVPTSRWRRWILPSGVLILAAVGLAVVLKNSPSEQLNTGLSPVQANAGPLDGELQVFVRPQAGAPQPLRVEESGALPVRAGGSMIIEVHLNQPAFIYLVWLDCEGNIVPLYPWNTDTLEIKDVREPLPVRRASKVIFSPLVFGGGWLFGKCSGTETVLLLARRAPLPADVPLKELLKTKPPPSVDQATAWIAFRSSHRDADRQRAPDLAAFCEPLATHFELIQAAQFHHAAE